jgi:hypothetical protein
LGIGVLGYIGILSHKEHPPEVWHIPPGTPCVYKYIYIHTYVHPLKFSLKMALKKPKHVAESGKFIRYLIKKLC